MAATCCGFRGAISSYGSNDLPNFSLKRTTVATAQRCIGQHCLTHRFGSRRAACLRWQRADPSLAGSGHGLPSFISSAPGGRRIQQLSGVRGSVAVHADLTKMVGDLTHGILHKLSPDAPHAPAKASNQRGLILTKLLSNVDKATYEELLADDCVIKKDIDPCEKGLTHSKSEWMRFLFDAIKPAIPDFTWGALTDEPGFGEVDKDGWCVCSIQVTGHHTGDSLRIGDLPPLVPSGARFCFPQQQVKIKIDTARGQVTDITFMPKPGTSVAALYKALGGVVPTSMIDYSKSTDDSNICVKGFGAQVGPL